MCGVVVAEEEEAEVEEGEMVGQIHLPIPGAFIGMGLRAWGSAEGPDAAQLQNRSQMYT